MNASIPFRCLMLVVFSLICVPLFAAVAAAAPLEASAGMPALSANFLMELVSDRSRLIQISLVAVAFGCAIIWWYK